MVRPDVEGDDAGDGVHLQVVLRGQLFRGGALIHLEAE